MMSTVSSQIHSVGASFARDFLAHWFPDQEPGKQVWLARLAVIVVGFVGLYLSLTQPALLTTLGVFSAAWAAQAVPAAVGALAGWRWPTSWGALAGTLGGTLVLFWVGLGFPQQQWQGLYAGLWALAANVILFVAVSLATSGSRPSGDTVAEYRRVGW